MADVTANGKPIVKTDRIETVEPLGPVAGNAVFAYFRFPKDVSGTFESLAGPDHSGAIAQCPIISTEPVKAIIHD